MWTQTRINGKEADVFSPSDRDERGAVIYLHGHNEERLSENDELTRLLGRFGLPVVCPRGRRSWWLDHVCEEFDAERTPAQFVREDVVDWIEQEWSLTPPKIALWGVSMGGQGVLNLAYRDARRFPVVAAIAPAIDFQIAYGQGWPLDSMFPNAEAARQETATLQIHPLNWPRYQFIACDPLDPTWYAGVQRLASKLSSSGVLYECDLETSYGGHNWDYFTRISESALQFLHNSLARV